VSHLFENYRRADVAFTHGRGVRLWDTAGREYLDFLAGIATSSLGHAHPRLVGAIAEQAGRYLHVSNLYRIPEQERAADRLVAASGGVLDRVFFCNSGTEANEAAIKLARKWGRRQGEDRFEIVAMHGGFHGRTLGALAATGTPAYHRGFEPLPGGFVHVLFDDLEAVRAAVTERTCAVLVEPVQGEGGVFPIGRQVLEGLAELCRERDLLLVLDEVQTAPGRTGSWFAFQHYGVVPDVVCCAKGLGGGVPVGAVLARDEVAAHLRPGEHGSTFGGNALASTAVETVLEVIEEEGLLERVRRSGERLAAGLLKLATSSGRIRAVRGLGLMCAIDLEVEAAVLVSRALHNGLVVGAVRPQTVRILPPLVLTEDEVDEGLARLTRALSEVG
jgi:predicted acetylornithine/succinylornithine family transaminase